MVSFLTFRRVLTAVVVLLLVSSFQPGERAAKVAGPVLWTVEFFATPAPRLPLHSLGVTVRPVEPVDLKITQPDDLGHTLQQLRALEDEVKKLRQENERLRQMRQTLGEAVSFELVDARVTAVTGPATAPLLRIDCGANSGVKRGCIVIAGYHLVGEVKDAGPMTAMVRLITGEGRISARLVAATAQVIAQPEPPAWLVWSAEQQAFVQQVSVQLHVEKGYVAQLSDDGWPPEAQGFVIGVVTGVRDDPADPLSFKQVIVTPTFQLDHLRRVTVLTAGGGAK